MIDGIQLLSLRNNTVFFSHTEEALSLIEEFDARRYSRIKRHLPIIAHVEQGYNYYNAKAKAFYVEDFFPSDVGFYAASIIHEATHAYLDSRKIPYTKEARQRHEILCTKEQYRFICNLIKINEDLSSEEKQNYINRYTRWFDEQIESKWWESNEREMRSIQLKKIKDLLSGV